VSWCHGVLAFCLTVVTEDALGVLLGRGGEERSCEHVDDGGQQDDQQQDLRLLDTPWF